MNSDLRIIRNFSLLKEIAISTPKISGAKVAAGILLKNKFISFGVNSYKTHPIQAKYAANALAIHLHVEIAAIKNAMYHIEVQDFQKVTLLICRVKIDIPTGKYIYGMAKPCAGCQRAILEFGIKRVWYSFDEEQFIRYNNN